MNEFAEVDSLIERALDIESKALPDDMEEKGVRRVRTEAGVRRFGQPIGSVIVRDGLTLPNITIMPKQVQGWDQVQGANGKTMYVGQDGKDWLVLDENDTEIAAASNMEEAFIAADRLGAVGTGRGKAPKAKPAKPNVDRTDTRLVAAGNLKPGDYVVSDIDPDFDQTVESVNMTPTGKVTIRFRRLDGQDGGRITRSQSERFPVAQPSSGTRKAKPDDGDDDLPNKIPPAIGQSVMMRNGRVADVVRVNKNGVVVRTRGGNGREYAVKPEDIDYAPPNAPAPRARWGKTRGVSRMSTDAAATPSKPLSYVSSNDRWSGKPITPKEQASFDALVDLTRKSKANGNRDQSRAEIALTGYLWSMPDEHLWEVFQASDGSNDPTVKKLHDKASWVLERRDRSEGNTVGGVNNEWGPADSRYAADETRLAEWPLNRANRFGGAPPRTDAEIDKAARRWTNAR